MNKEKTSTTKGRKVTGEESSEKKETQQEEKRIRKASEKEKESRRDKIRKGKENSLKVLARRQHDQAIKIWVVQRKKL